MAAPPFDRIRETLNLPYCWVCGEKFIECGGLDPRMIRNQHHVIPQANGGSDGPTVSLCSAHHDLLHAVATQVLASKPFAHLLGDLTGTDQSAKIQYLASVVVRSTVAVADDPNKPAQITLALSGPERAMLRRLANLNDMSMANVLRSLLALEYQRRFPRVPLK